MVLSTHTDRISPVVKYQKDLLDARKTEIGLADVWYGDQQNIPKFPANCVEPGPTSKELSGIGGKGRTDNTFRIYHLLYLHSIKDVQKARQEIDELGEAVMDILHEDVTMGGLVIHGFVTDVEPGYAQRNNVLLRSVRLTWTGQTKTLI